MHDTIDTYEDLSKYTCDQLRIMNRTLESKLMEIMSDIALCDGMSEQEKMRVLDAIRFMQRTGEEILRRDAAPAPGPFAVHYECMPDGSAPVRLSFTILAF